MSALSGRPGYSAAACVSFPASSLSLFLSLLSTFSFSSSFLILFFSFPFLFYLFFFSLLLSFLSPLNPRGRWFSSFSPNPSPNPPRLQNSKKRKKKKNIRSRSSRRRHAPHDDIDLYCDIRVPFHPSRDFLRGALFFFPVSKFPQSVTP